MAGLVCGFSLGASFQCWVSAISWYLVLWVGVARFGAWWLLFWFWVLDLVFWVGWWGLRASFGGFEVRLLD